MRDHATFKTGLTMTWVAVREDAGRVRMEARWAVAASVAAKPRAA